MEYARETDESRCAGSHGGSLETGQLIQSEDATIPVIARSTSKRAGHADVFFSSTVQEVPGLNSSASGAPRRDQLGTLICAEAKALCDEVP